VKHGIVYEKYWEIIFMKAFCDCCGEEVEVLFRRHWRFSSSPVPCPQFRKHICMQCGKHLSDGEIENAKQKTEERKKLPPK
jgi:hypothetical protein